MDRIPAYRTPAGRACGFDRNRRLEESWRAILSLSVLAAVAVHLVLLTVWPRSEITTEAKPAQRAQTEMVIASLPSVEAAPAPAEVRIPAPALLPAMEIDLAEHLPDITFPELETAWEVVLPEPPRMIRTRDEWEDYLPFTPTMVRPVIDNRRDVDRFLRVRYQPVLRATGAQGTVEMQFWIDEEGIAQRAVVAISSGFDVLDRLAVELSRVIRFRPARRGGDLVPVNVVMPIRFVDGGVR